MARALPVRPGHTGYRSAAVSRVLGPCGGTPPSSGSPTIASVTPSMGNVAGGTTVTITGTNFSAGATVTFGGTPGSNVVVTSSTSLTVATPAAGAGAVTVTVTVSGQSGSLSSGFTFITTPSGGIVYNLRTDRAILPVASLTAPSAAGLSVVDPTFGTTITRVTDPSSPVNSVDWATFKNNWSSDGSYFSASNWLFTRAGAPVKWIHDVSNNQMTVWFAFQQPNIIYGAGGAGGGFGVVQYDYLADQYTLLFNIDGGSFPNRTQNGGYNGIVVTDYADDHFAMYFNGGGQDEFRTVMVWERSSNTYKVLDLDSGLVGGPFPAGSPWTSHTSSMIPLADQNGPLSIPLLAVGASDGFHSVELDRAGRYVSLGINAYLQATDVQVGFSGGYIWDLQTHQLFRFSPPGNNTAPYPAGHAIYGFNEVCNLGGGLDSLGGNSPVSAYLRPVNFSTLPTSTGLVQLINPPPPPGSGNWNSDAHLSWASNMPGQRTPLINTRYYGNNTTAASPGDIPANTLWDNEIIAIDPDTFTVYRVAHHRCWYTGDGNTAPHGNVSRQGDRLIYNSNWLGTLQGGRADIFMVDLPIV